LLPIWSLSILRLTICSLSALRCMARRADGGPDYTYLRTGFLLLLTAAGPDGEVRRFVTANTRTVL
jgi:hypothetical protein